MEWGLSVRGRGYLSKDPMAVPGPGREQCLVQQVPGLTVRAGVLTVGTCLGKVVIKSGMGF